ncbi:hypothetical protein ACFWBF_16240 [Streptomyces sp. NPDC060028]|uniref:hypothetical protein n=1 Tax=Streptomyces sp. NPDC060028 TaxID=3347041 RepID=UPI0036C5CF2C
MTRKNSGVRWVHAIPIAVGLACGIYAFSLAVPRLVTQLSGVEGTFRAERCTWETASHGDRQAACEGSFTASDGSFTIRRIEAETPFDTPPTGPVASRVSGPSADKAVRPGIAGSLAPMGLGLAGFAFPAWALTAATRDALARRRTAAGPAPLPAPPIGAKAGDASDM